MRRFCLLLVLALTACQITAPLQPTPTAPVAPPVEPSAIGAASASATALAATWTPTPTPTPTRSPTHTPTATPTTPPTSTPTSVPAAAPAILIERPLPNEFVSGTISVAGRVAQVAGGSVAVQLRAPEGQALEMEPVAAATTASGDGIVFSAELTHDLPPTPRLAVLHVAWTDDSGARAEAGQPINLLGRYPRVDRLTLELPESFTRGTDPTITVRGVAPGPPVKVLVRLLDDADQVLESLEARLRWLQPGQPCAFDAALTNNPAASQVQVITLGRDDAVIEAVRVRLAPGS